MLFFVVGSLELAQDRICGEGPIAQKLPLSGSKDLGFKVSALRQRLNPDFQIRHHGHEIIEFVRCIAPAFVGDQNHLRHGNTITNSKRHTEVEFLKNVSWNVVCQKINRNQCRLIKQLKDYVSYCSWVSTHTHTLKFVSASFDFQVRDFVISEWLSSETLFLCCSLSRSTLSKTLLSPSSLINRSSTKNIRLN